MTGKVADTRVLPVNYILKSARVTWSSQNKKQTFSNSGGGLLPLQRLDSAHTAFLVIVRRVDLVSSLKEGRTVNKSGHSRHATLRMFEVFEFWCKSNSTYINSGGRMLQLRTKSLHMALSPAIFPNAHTA